MAIRVWTNRIEADEVVASFQKTQFSPHKGYYYGEFHNWGKACAMGAFYANQAGLNKEKIIENYKKKRLDGTFFEDHLDKEIFNQCNDFINELVGYDYKEGFAKGFDGEPLNERTLLTATVKERCRLGHEDGAKAREACIKAGIIAA